MRAQLAVGPTSTSIPSYTKFQTLFPTNSYYRSPVRAGRTPCHAITIGQPASLDIGHNGAPPGPTHPTGASNVRGLSSPDRAT